MNFHQLYLVKKPLPQPLTIGLLRQYIQPDAAQWISLEPRAWLPERNGQLLSGRLPGLAPLSPTLPVGLDDHPLLNASLYGEEHWMHFHDAHPLSQEPGGILTWSKHPSDGAKPIDGLQRQRQTVLSWHDRDRFGLSTDSALPASLAVERYYQSGKLIAWCLIPTRTEVCA